jgi:hypothetical protein
MVLGMKRHDFPHARLVSGFRGVEYFAPRDDERVVFVLAMSEALQSAVGDSFQVHVSSMKEE